jgi:hypothetical protein
MNYKNLLILDWLNIQQNTQVLMESYTWVMATKNQSTIKS